MPLSSLQSIIARHYHPLLELPLVRMVDILQALARVEREGSLM
jgi:hypothetical protein